MNVGLDRFATIGAAPRAPEGLARGCARASRERHARRSRTSLTCSSATGIKPAVLFFGPEHGYGGEAQDMIGVPSADDRAHRRPDRQPLRRPLRGSLARPEHSRRSTCSSSISPTWARVTTRSCGRRCSRSAPRARAGVARRSSSIGRTRSAVISRSVEGATHARPGFLSFVGLEPVPDPARAHRRRDAGAASRIATESRSATDGALAIVARRGLGSNRHSPARGIGPSCCPRRTCRRSRPRSSTRAAA